MGIEGTTRHDRTDDAAAQDDGKQDRQQTDEGRVQAKTDGPRGYGVEFAAFDRGTVQEARDEGPHVPFSHARLSSCNAYLHMYVWLLMLLGVCLASFEPAVV
jgi:hypothetical protein